MEPRTDTETEERESIARLEELLLPHVAMVALPMAEALAIQQALTPLPEEDIKMWSIGFAALTLCDGGTVGQALREAKRVRAMLRRPEPPTVDEVRHQTGEILRQETRALVGDWLAALKGHADARGGALSRGDLDAAMLPPFPTPPAMAFVNACQARLLGSEGARDVLMCERMSLEDPDLCLPHDVIRVLRLRGVDVIP